MLKFKQYINEKNDEIPHEPGTVEIPKDHIRLYHQTPEENNDSIKKHGIMLSKALGIEGPKAIYADERGFYGKPTDRNTVEFHVHKTDWKPPFVNVDRVPPEQIIAIHEPWHELARNLIKDDNHAVKNILSGEHDDLLNDSYYGPAIKYIKNKFRSS